MKLALLAAAWLAGIVLGSRIDADMLPVALLLLAALPAGMLLRLLGRSLWWGVKPSRDLQDQVCRPHSRRRRWLIR